MHAKRTRICFPELPCNLAGNSACMTKSSFITEKIV